MLDLTNVFTTFPLLETERCLLRQVSDDDADALFRILSSAEVSRYLGRHPLTKYDEVMLRVNTYRKTFEEQTGIAWMIIDRAEGQLIGTCVLWKLDPTHYRAELGYILAPQWWGQGIIPEVASAVVSFGFTQIGLHSMEAHIAPANVGSRRVLEKLGFVQEGYFRENFYSPVTEAFEDTAVFSLLKSEWMSQEGA
jgi:[ribosomal protein S5]-alanine N-acetyltransferase